MSDPLEPLAELNYRQLVDYANRMQDTNMKLEAENAELKRRTEHLKNAIRNTVRHFREDNCTEVARCPYLDAAESAIHD